MKSKSTMERTDDSKFLEALSSKASVQTMSGVRLETAFMFARKVVSHSMSAVSFHKKWHSIWQATVPLHVHCCNCGHNA
eukprot:3400818-Amphidinium_carterae.1